MSKIKSDTKSKNKNTFSLYVILFFSCTSLIVINYVTIRVLSASRAYVNAESNYSKGQNKAARYLITYLYFENEVYWNSFEEELKIPLGDQKARLALIQNPDEYLAKEGFREGKNKEQDLDDMIWAFINFKSVSFLKEAIDKWEIGDGLINQLRDKGFEIRKKIKSHELDEQSKREIISEIGILCDELSIVEDEFSDILGDGTRDIKDKLILINIFFILTIITSVIVYYSIVLKKVIASEKDIKTKKEELQDTIEILENTKTQLSTEIVQHKKLIGSISHDIKSPIKYLAMTSKYIYEESKFFENKKLRKNTKSVYSSALELYNFIDSLLTYSKIFVEGKVLGDAVCNLNELVQEKFNLFNEIADASNTILKNQIEPSVISKTNKDVISVVLHNLIDNSIKNTENGVIKVYTYIKNKKLYLVVEDTGKGFKEADLIYYNELSNEQSAEKFILRNRGMGLPMIIELIHLINGNLKFYNNIEQGSRVEIITDLTD